MNSTLRSDIILKLNKISFNMRKFYSAGLFLAIEQGWFEQPPQPDDHKLNS
ncbi:hypothetical protein J2R98_001292 [Alkalibacillus filiformis]|uniref:Uncharacterized protein n=2 Tax=Alkalibacillus filiformis TaxID=200990 RepID=A0ABU0DT54_9BACI|nr:hypothetical protein [Alkalibacillus filiformis]